MKYFLYILSFAICLQSCVTRNRCNAKFPPQIITKDSIVLKDTVIFKDTVIYLPGETLNITAYIHDTIVYVDTIVKGNNTQLHLTIAKGRVKATCTADSLQLVINNLQKIISTRQQFKTITQTVTQQVTKPYIPLWLILALIASVGWNFRKLLLTGLQKLLQ